MDDRGSILQSYFSKRKEVLCVYLFGSVAAGRENRFSDIDVAVLFDPAMPEANYTQQQLALMDELSRLLHRDVDVVLLNKASIFLKFQVLRNGKLNGTRYKLVPGTALELAKGETKRGGLAEADPPPAPRVVLGELRGVP